jgi:hypothetical protein
MRRTSARQARRVRISRVTWMKPPSSTEPRKTRWTSSSTTNLLPTATSQSDTPPSTSPALVDAVRNRPSIRSLIATTTSSTTLSRTAVSSEIVNVSLITSGRYSIDRLSTTT